MVAMCAGTHDMAILNPAMLLLAELMECYCPNLVTTFDNCRTVTFNGGDRRVHRVRERSAWHCTVV